MSVKAADFRSFEKFWQPGIKIYKITKFSSLNSGVLSVKGLFSPEGCTVLQSE